jgi:hypothetical protein
MHKKNRPFLLSLFSISFLGLGLWNGFRFIQAILFWSTLINYLGVFVLLYICISGTIWCSIWVFLARGFWLGKPWAWYGGLFSAAGYVLWYWLDRILLQQSHSNWLFAIVTSFFFVFSIGFLLHRKFIDFFFINRSSPFCSFFSGKK